MTLLSFPHSEAPRFYLRFEGRAWLKEASDPVQPQKGWRRFVWTRKRDEAKPFYSRLGAEMFVHEHIIGPVEIVEA